MTELKAMKFSFKLATTVLALITASFAGINVSSPANGATVGSPTQFVASASSTSPIVAMKVYVDNNIAYSANSGNINTSIPMAAGWRYVVVQSWDSTGAVQKQVLNVNVSGTTSAPPSTSTGVTISQPSNGANVSTPMRLVSTSTSSAGVATTHVYVDGALKYQTTGGNVDTSLDLGAGSRYIVVQSWTVTGAVIKSTPITVNVTTSTTQQPVQTPTTGGTLFSDIDQMSGWEHCDACSGPGGNGLTTPYSLTQNRVDPAMDGRATEFWLGGSTPYASALWWKQLGGNSSATNFVYDLYYYIKNPDAAQALEFDVNQSVNGLKYIFGTECNLREFGKWRVWDTANARWMLTSVPCAKPTAYTWHHVTFEFQRSGNMAKFISVTVDGVKGYFNQAYYARPVSNAYEINVAYQMDGNSSMTNYSTWVDKVSLRYW